MGVAWEHLFPLLDDPVGSGYLISDAVRNLEREPARYSIRPFEMLNGAVGGGIIVAHVAPGTFWLPWDVLRRFAEIERPNGMFLARDANCESVCYLTSDRFECALMGYRVARSYGPVNATLEHVGIAGERVFWVIEHKIKESHPWAIELDAWARAFGVQAEPFNPTLDLVDATKTRFLGNDRTYSWYEIRGGRSAAGFQFAVLVYLAAHLQMIARRRFKSMHLLADIECKPSVLDKCNLRPNEFDAAGRVIASTDADGNRYTFQYDGAGALTSVTDPKGRVRQLP